MKYLLGLGLLVLAGCSSNQVSSRQPSSESWNIKSVSLNTKELAGNCDLAPTAEVRRSSMLSTTTIVGNLKTEGCSLAGSSASVTSSAMFNATYIASRPETFSVDVKVGDLEYANTAEDDSALSKQGYEDVHMTGGGVYKLKSTKALTLKGSCGQATMVGTFGFRKANVICNLSNGAGAIVLEQE